MNTLGWTITISTTVLLGVFIAGVVQNFAATDSSEGADVATTELVESVGTPKAVVESQEFDFGVLEPDSSGEHEFTIRNEGDAPLKLRFGGKTCKCVGFEITPREVPPGEGLPPPALHRAPNPWLAQNAG